MDRVRGQQMPKTGPTLDYLGRRRLPGWIWHGIPAIVVRYNDIYILNIFSNTPFDLFDTLPYSLRTPFVTS